MKNIVLFLGYDGSNYCGFQKQKGEPTIQEELEKAIFKLTNENVCIVGCGRTDSGVHAEKYCVSFFSDTKVPVEKIPNALNYYLPDDIVIYDAFVEDESFNARFSVKKKTYKYLIDNSCIQSPFARKYSWHIKYNLDIEKMQQACKYFCGEHDFVSFMASGGQVKTTVRTIFSANVERCGDFIEFTVCGNGFLYNMVRIMVGTLVAVGSGKLEPFDIEKILKAKDRNMAGQTAPPHGLFMKDIEY